MTMYNSQRVNNDPEPWKGFSHMRYAKEEGQSNFAVWGPRPEYDNNPNPILIKFREDVDSDVADSSLFEAWWRINWLEGVLNDHEIEYCEITDQSLLRVKHALRVFNKIQGVYGDEKKGQTNANDG